MKYCGKCGSPMEDNAKFCGKCGTPVADMNVTGQPISSMQSPARQLVAKAAPIGVKPVNHIVAAVMSILLLIFWFVPTVSASALNQSQGFSMAQQDDSTVIMVITVILSLASTVLAALPVFLGSVEKRRHLMIIQIFTAVWHLFWHICVFVYVTSEMNDFDRTVIKIGPTFWGVLCLIAGVMLLVDSILIIVKGKKSPKA